MEPLSPVKLIITPSWDQLSYQKEVVEPSFTYTQWNCWERGLSFNNFFHIQEPKELEAFTLQKKLFMVICFLIRWTHKDDLHETMRQINFRQETLLTSSRGLKPRPPSSFGEQTSDHAIFAFCEDIIGPDHRKAEQRLLISWIHFFRKRKSDIQKSRPSHILILIFYWFCFPFYLIHGT